jgi:prepilin-type N-terminal cleavage/methylation domain-containing protein/prepilin-type processing-associated H-X9-DG protein
MRANPNRSGRAFTLVELLVVIGIIAVLIGILLPVIGRARDQANTTACQAAMRQLGQLIYAYSVEFKGSVPFSYYTERGATGSQTVGENDGDAQDKITYVWWSVLRKYMRKGTASVYDNSTLLPDGSRGTRFMGAFNCPSAQEREAGCDYGSNMVIMPERNWETIVNAGTPEYRLLTRPAQLAKLYPDNILLWDATELGNTSPPFSRQYVCGYDLDKGNFNNPKTFSKLRFRGLIPAASSTPTVGDEWPIDPGPNVDDGSVGSRGNVRWRHSRGTAANFLFQDGTVRTYKITRDAGTPNAKGDALRKYFRPRPPVDYK